MDIPEGALLAAAAAVAGAVNSVAGGGTLLTFPALVHAGGLTYTEANATSTVALWPGLFGAVGGYRKDLEGSRRFVATMAAPSLLGGGAGAWLLLATGERTFALVVPWLILFATLLFALSGRIAARFGPGAGEGDPRPGPGAVLYQLGVGVYGGYFGAGIGILMLAMLGTLGMRDIHRMNGVKAILGVLINMVATAVFVLAGSLVRWPEGLLMAAAAILGGAAGARLSKRVPREGVRGFVIATGFAVAGVEFWKAYG
jgi:uncharacterized membrane protein YfcA